MGRYWRLAACSVCVLTASAAYSLSDRCAARLQCPVTQTTSCQFEERGGQTDRHRQLDGYTDGRRDIHACRERVFGLSSLRHRYSNSSSASAAADAHLFISAAYIVAQHLLAPIFLLIDTKWRLSIGAVSAKLCAVELHRFWTAVYSAIYLLQQ